MKNSKIEYPKLNFKNSKSLVHLSFKHLNLFSISGLELRNYKREEGFTLIELLLYMGLFSILIGILMQIFTSILAIHLNSQSYSSVDQDGGFIVSRFTYDLHAASSVSLVSSSKLQLITGIGTRYYCLDGSKNLFLTANCASPTSADQLNSTNTFVDSINFTNLANLPSAQDPNPKPSIQMVLNLKTRIIQIGGGQQSETFQTTMQTR